MKKLLYVLATSAIAATAFGETLVEKTQTWGTGADDLKYMGNYALTRTGWSRDLNGKYIDTNSFNATLGIVGYRLGLSNVTVKGGGSLTLSVTDERDANGNLLDRADEKGTPTIGFINFSSMIVDNATVNFTHNGTNFRTAGTRSLLTLQNGSTLNLTNFTGEGNGNNSLVIKGIQPVAPDESTPAPARSTVNFLGDNSNFTNVYFESDSGTGLNINFNTTSDKVNINYTNTAGVLDWRSYVTANNKDVTINNSQTNNAEMSFSSSTFKDFKTLTFKGSSTGVFVFNSTRFRGKGIDTSKVYVDKSVSFRGTTVIADAEVIVNKDVAVNFICGWGNVLDGGGVLTIEGGGLQNLVTVNVDAATASNDLFQINANTTLVVNREFSVVAVNTFNMANGAKLVLNKDSTVNKLISLTGNTATLGVGADLVMQGFDMGGKTALTLDFVDGATLELKELANIGSIILADDVYERFKVYNVDETNGLPSDSFIAKFSALSGKDIEFDRIDAGTYWVNVVPEPAHWAVILGALALAFVAYRKRK